MHLHRAGSTTPPPEDYSAATRKQEAGLSAVLLSHSDLCLSLREPEQGRLHGVLQRISMRRQQLRPTYRTAAERSDLMKARKAVLRTSLTKENSNPRHSHMHDDAGDGATSSSDKPSLPRQRPYSANARLLDMEGSGHDSGSGSSNEGSCEVVCYSSGGSPVFHFRRKHGAGASSASCVHDGDAGGSPASSQGEAGSRGLEHF